MLTFAGLWIDKSQPQRRHVEVDISELAQEIKPKQSIDLQAYPANLMVREPREPCEHLDPEIGDRLTLHGEAGEQI